jgi:hypothetical protein
MLAKPSVILTLSGTNSQPPCFCWDFGDSRSRARVTAPGFRTARRVASRRQAFGSTPANFADSISEQKSVATHVPCHRQIYSHGTPSPSLVRPYMDSFSKGPCKLITTGIDPG